ncbi:unnamed protein product [Rotaria sp. Silwood2]|nr:unnamed protein product [Rotaria sp. Silwood2]CAF4262244.1 unnamed protein product [Rotaria sp. Silwood2]
MTQNKCKSFENLLPTTTTKQPHTQFPEHFEKHRNELHRELAMQWPFRTDIPDSTFMQPTISKSTAHSNIRDGNKSNMTLGDNDILHQTYSNLRSNNLTSINHTGSIGKKSEATSRTLPTDGKFSSDERQQHIEWISKAQEGIITYQLPDGLPDGFALYNKLQKLMKTNTIYLNDRSFWTTLENRFKNLRKQNCQENMERLRQIQQQDEQDLISKGILPYTTEEAIKQYSEQQRTKMKTDKIVIDNSNYKKCLIDYNPSNNFSNKKFEDNLLNKNEELEAFETDNVHPRVHEIFTDYKFQTKLGKDIGEKFQNDLYKNQAQIKTIFPKTNQQDLIRQELEVVKTSEGLYAYSNRLAKQISS